MAARAMIRPTEDMIDMSRLQLAIIKFIGANPTTIGDHPIIEALAQQGITMFNKEFVFMTLDHIDKLMWHPPRSAPGDLPVPLDLSMRLPLRALLAFYHQVSHLNGGGVAIEDIRVDRFHEFRVRAYDPLKPIVPWALMTTKNEGLQNWNKMN